MDELRRLNYGVMPSLSAHDIHSYDYSHLHKDPVIGQIEEEIKQALTLKLSSDLVPCNTPSQKQKPASSPPQHRKPANRNLPSARKPASKPPQHQELALSSHNNRLPGTPDSSYCSNSTESLSIEGEIQNNTGASGDNYETKQTIRVVIPTGLNEHCLDSRHNSFRGDAHVENETNNNATEEYFREDGGMPRATPAETCLCCWSDSPSVQVVRKYGWSVRPRDISLWRTPSSVTYSVYSSDSNTSYHGPNTSPTSDSDDQCYESGKKSSKRQASTRSYGTPHSRAETAPTASSKRFNEELKVSQLRSPLRSATKYRREKTLPANVTHKAVYEPRSRSAFVVRSLDHSLKFQSKEQSQKVQSKEQSQTVQSKGKEISRRAQTARLRSRNTSPRHFHRAKSQTNTPPHSKSARRRPHSKLNSASLDYFEHMTPLVRRLSLNK